LTQQTYHYNQHGCRSSVILYLFAVNRIDVTIPDKNGALAVHKASRAGNLRMVKELIAAGSPVLPTDSQGNSPLHEAAAGGHVEVLRYLLTAQVCGVTLWCADGGTLGVLAVHSSHNIGRSDGAQALQMHREWRCFVSGVAANWRASRRQRHC
jgi:ankyrin repeat protein